MLTYFLWGINAWIVAEDFSIQGIDPAIITVFLLGMGYLFSQAINSCGLLAKSRRMGWLPAIGWMTTNFLKLCKFYLSFIPVYSYAIFEGASGKTRFTRTGSESKLYKSPFEEVYAAFRMGIITGGALGLVWGLLQFHVMRELAAILLPSTGLHSL